MTPSKAIKVECGVCRRGMGPCESKYCALNRAGKSLERIKAHCVECAPDHCVDRCSGQVIGSQAVAYNSMYGIPLVDGKAECPLFPFRYGHNPNLSKVRSEDQKKCASKNLRPYGKGENVVDKVPV
jgi:hypothetical protein